ncbi:MAG TPA: hypothetical protein VKX96_02735 [Chloroflexota bacterium]|jgi:hypothetical protein|nr:hypothetical protein [Chloroflexota bacterium]
MKSPKDLPRRAILGAALSLGAIVAQSLRRTATADEEVKEEDKISKAEAKYQNQPKGQQRCEICLQFEPPSKCKIVHGPIDPKGWCQYFAAKENAH